MAPQRLLPNGARIVEPSGIDHCHAVAERGGALLELDRLPHAPRRDLLGRHVRGVARGLLVRDLFLVIAERGRPRRRSFAADVIGEELPAVAAEDVDARGAGGVDPMVRSLDAPGVAVALAPFGASLDAAAGEDVHAE